MTFWKWSRTAANNANADSTCPFPEGMRPGAVNDGTRGMMAAIAKYRDDVSGAIVTSGTNSAYTLASYQGFDTLAHMDGAMIAFTPHATNGANATLNVDGLGAKALRFSPGISVQDGVLIQGTPYVATYYNATSEWILHGFGGDPYGIPLGAGMDYWGPTTPSAAFAFPIGQAISRTAYAKLFAMFGTIYGSGDGTTTFNLPDKTGRVSAMKESSATRLTPSYFGGNSTSLGATGGNESVTVQTENLPPYTPSGSVSSVTLTYTRYNSLVGVGTDGPQFSNVWQNTSTQNTSTVTPTFTGSPQGGTSTPLMNVQPTIVCNYILRIL